MNIFARFALHRAARIYARRLPGELQTDWGASAAYTVDQVRSAIARSQVGGRYVAVAYAAFLTEEDYLSVAWSLPLVLPYDVARSVFQRESPWGDKFSEQRDRETNSATNRTGLRS
jgi:hypothetical protein